MSCSKLRSSSNKPNHWNIWCESDFYINGDCVLCDELISECLMVVLYTRMVIVLYCNVYRWFYVCCEFYINICILFLYSTLHVLCAVYISFFYGGFVWCVDISYLIVDISVFWLRICLYIVDISSYKSGFTFSFHIIISSLKLKSQHGCLHVQE